MAHTTPQPPQEVTDVRLVSQPASLLQSAKAVCIALVYVLVVLLSLSIAITQLAEKCKRLTQANAILEKRVRDLEGKNR